MSMAPAVYLLLCFTSAVLPVSTNDRFLVSAPNVFHVGVKEQVSVQLSSPLLNQDVSLYLEDERSGQLISEKEIIQSTVEGQIKMVQLEVSRDKISELPSFKLETPYALLVCEIRPGDRRMARVLISQHRGYIFIQTNQPVYNPTQRVKFRIFTLDHSMRPHADTIYVTIINAGGNKVKRMTVNAKDGIFFNTIQIPDVSEPGVWRIVAHFQGDEKNAVTREFHVKKFVLPSFDVSIQPQQSYYLVDLEEFTFNILAVYSYGEPVAGAFHCRFGVREDDAEDQKEAKTEIVFIRGMEQTGSVKDGNAEVSIRRDRILDLLKKSKTGLTDMAQLAQNGAKLYIAVSVTDINSGELQEAEVLLPIVSRRYSVDLSRTRSHFIPKVPFQVQVVVRLPNGSPAPDVQVEIHMPVSDSEPQTAKTNKEGAVNTVFFSIPSSAPSAPFTVTVDGHKYDMTPLCATSPSKSFLFISVGSKVMTPGSTMQVDFTTVQGHPVDGQIHYLVLSRGILRKSGSIKAGNQLTSLSLLISTDLTPYFRLIGYYYDQGGDIIADAVWVDVNDQCEGKISLSLKDRKEYKPGTKVELNIDVGGQTAKVALLAVDKAIYALNVHNKLTAKQVFSSMQSYDLGCSYFGGRDTAAVFNDAGLSFISHSTKATSQMRKGFRCESGFRRQKRSLNLQQLMMSKVASYTDESLRECCQDGFTLIPMKLSCEERAQRVSRRGKRQACVAAFLDCCLEGVKLRDKKMREEVLKGRGRTSSAAEMEDFFDMNAGSIRRFFEPSFEFRVINVDRKTMHPLVLPDSITTWEIQAVSLSSSHGFCVAEPQELRVMKRVFISLQLPYAVKRYEQLFITAVVYNYGDEGRELSVHMKSVEGLCSPGSASSLSHLSVNVSANSAQTVTFSAVPMVTGHIPVTLLLYDKKEEMGLDTIEKMLLVETEGVEKREERTHFLDIDGRSGQTIEIDGEFPNSTVPDSGINLFVKVEGEVFGQSTVLPLLSSSGVKELLRAPRGCAEQTMIRMSPTALALRYLDHSQGWKELPAGTRDTALTHIEDGYTRILTFKKKDGSYGAWLHRDSSTWLTALVVKVMSLVLERQWEGRGERGRVGKGFVSEEEISASVKYLISKQDNGHYIDPHPVIHREMQGGVGGQEGDVSLTAFITIALHNALPFLSEEDRKVTEASISASVDYLDSVFPSLKRPYAVAITAYCLSICQKDSSFSSSAWSMLKGLATRDGDCLMWQSRSDLRLQDEVQHNRVPVSEAITVETTAYALLTALANDDMETADSVVCWLARQENYGGGFRSTQDTIVALEALSEYAIKRPPPASTQLDLQFSVPGRSEQEKMSLDKQGEKVEAELKRLMGNKINVRITGKGRAKMKVVMAYHALQPEDICQMLSITVKVQGKVKYTAQILDDYDYTDYGGDGEKKEEEDREVPQTEIEWFDARSRRRRDTSQSLKAQETVDYEICVSHDLSRNLSGMAIADITLLSGFEALTEDLEQLKKLSDQYISHYETKEGRVLLYFDEIPDGRECIQFGAVQKVPIGLLQPAPASFYDYYEPDRKCTVFYSAPERSKMVSTLCSEDVCQCAEKPCHKEKKTFDMKIKKKDRLDFACYYPTVDYGYKVKIDSVSTKSNFYLYHTTVTDVLRASSDESVAKGSIRVFAKRRQCKGALETGQTYLIMGKDGTTTDFQGQMQYLLDSSSWVEMMPRESKCKATNYRDSCKELNAFLMTYQMDGCTQ